MRRGPPRPCGWPPRTWPELGIVDRVVPEPLGGAHRHPDAAATFLRATILDCLVELSAVPIPDLLGRRRAKYRQIGVFGEDDTF